MQGSRQLRWAFAFAILLVALTCGSATAYASSGGTAPPGSSAGSTHSGGTSPKDPSSARGHSSTGGVSPSATRTPTAPVQPQQPKKKKKKKHRRRRHHHPTPHTPA